MTITTDGITDQIIKFKEIDENIIQFITVNTISPIYNPKEVEIDLISKRKTRFQTISKISDYLSKFVLHVNFEHHIFTDEAIEIGFVSKEMKFLLHEIRFLEDKIHSMILNAQDRSIKDLIKLMDFLNTADSVDDRLQVSIDTQGLFRYVSTKPSNITSLETLRNEKIKKFLMLKESIEKNTNFAKTVKAASECFDTQLHFISDNNEQMNYELCISKTPAYAKAVSKIFNDFCKMKKGEFTLKIFETSNEILKLASLKTAELQGTSFFMLFRYIFDKCITINKNYFLSNAEIINKKVIDKIKISDICIPNGLINNCKPEDCVKDVFKEDECFIKCGRIFETSFFRTNPLDVLFDFHTSLKSLEEVIQKYKPEGDCVVNSFDSLFSFLLGSLLTSEYICCIPLVVNFVNDFLPENSVGPEFSFAKMTFNAIYMQLLKFQESYNLNSKK